MFHESKAIAFDVDRASLDTIRKALPDWQIDIVSGASAGSLSKEWQPGVVDLLFIRAGADMTNTLGLCRFLAYCGAFADGARSPRETNHRLPGRRAAARQALGQQTDAPLVLLVAANQGSFVRAALEAGVDCCLVVPIHTKEVTAMLVRLGHDNQPGRHTLNLDPAQSEDLWRDDGGQG
jgi:PleD family two-component response regulator